jgi:hypothetical protein
MGLVFASAQVQAGPWLVCGTLSQMTVANKGTIPGKPVNKFEYGIAYNSVEPMPIFSTAWNNGIRIYNKLPFLIQADNPSSMRQGGFVFYSGTLANDDNCGNGNFRHQYWQIETDSTVTTIGTNGCYGSTGTGIDLNGVSNPPIYCRTR